MATLFLLLLQLLHVHLGKTYVRRHQDTFYLSSFVLVLLRFTLVRPPVSHLKGTFQIYELFAVKKKEKAEFLRTSLSLLTLVVEIDVVWRGGH
jgi:hypothetical protein